MNVIGINGSPRKKNNTATMLNFALEGAKSMGAVVEKVNLYDLKYTGCVSCFACKLIDGTYHGRCALKDDLNSVLEKIRSSDALILATPIYFGDVSGMTRCFLERLWFPSLLYRADGEVAYDKKLRTGIIYTMNVEDPYEYNYDRMFSQNEAMFEQYVGETRSIFTADTYQYSDYSKYESGIFDAQHKLEVHNSRFNNDCERAYALGAELVK